MENISPRTFNPGEGIRLTAALKAVPFQVPHRDEYTDTLGFVIAGPERRLLYIPDIRSWGAWERPLDEALRSVDAALLDGTFFGPGDLPGRDMTEIGHPLITDTLRRIERLPAGTRAKVRFIHLNHTNPALDPDGAARRTIEQSGAGLAEEKEIFGL
jgi:pyrroloquinoline quinone biosynthesis protein B